MKHNRTLAALIASLLVALPLSFASITVGAVWIGGELKNPDLWNLVLTHPGFWFFYGKALFWFVLSGFLSGVLLNVFLARQKET
jgi:hypothetical protein